MTIQDISLRKLSGSKGGSQASAKQTADNLFATDVVEVLVAVSEGPIQGLENGPKTYLIGETQLQDNSGLNNFDNFELISYKGTEAGEDINSRLGGFGASTNVGVEMASNVSIVRQGVHTDLDYIDFRFVINQLVTQNDKGTFNFTGKWMVEYKLLSEAVWRPVRTADNAPLPPQISGDSFDVFYGDKGTANNVNASPGDRPTFWTSQQPVTTAHAGIWFDTSNNYKPMVWNGGAWNFPAGLRFVNSMWIWSEASSWGADKATNAFVGPRMLMVPEQGDYWLNTSEGRAYFFNGSTWIIAGSSLRPGAFGANSTGGSTVVLQNGEIAVTGKTTSSFPKEFRLPVARAKEPYMFRVTKTTPINTTENFFSITWESFQEVTAKGYNFPGVACTQVVARASDQFSSIPDFSGIYLGRIVRVPSNYNAATRAYTGVWDGAWKLAYTNNVAFVCYDLVMNDRYGMNAYYPIVLDKWDVYNAGVWCDTPTASGKPRFTFNGLISDPKGGRDAINYLCGIFAGRFFDDGNGSGVIRIDQDNAPVAMFMPENVVDGLFTYSFTEISTRHNDLTVTFTNPDLGWQVDRRRVYDQDHINQYGRIPYNFEAVGCTDPEEAVRRGRYHLITGIKETMMVNFKTNRKGLYMSPYDTILIADEDMETGVSGRVQSVSGPRTIQLRDVIYLEPGFAYKISFQLISPATQNFILQTLDLSSATGALTQLVTLTDLPPLPEHVEFTIAQTNGAAAPMSFRVLSIAENDGDPDNIDIQAIQMNRAKWLFVDGHVGSIGELDQSVLNSKNKPEPVPNVRVRVANRLAGTRNIVTLTLDWDSSPTKTVTHYKIEGSRDNGPISTLADVPVTQFEWDDIPPGEYYFQVSAVDVNGYPSKPSIIEHRLIGDTRVLEGIKSLRLVDEPSATEFESRSPVFQWGAATDTYFRQYVVQVRDTTNTVIREELLTTTNYTYEYSINKADAGGTPRRAFKIAVATQDIYGFRSDFTVLAVNNAAPAAPTTQSVKVLYDAAVVSYDVPSIRDFRGVMIHASTADGFKPSAANLVYKGPNNNVAIPLATGTRWYMRLAFYDLFEDSTLNYGNQLAVDIPIPTGPKDVTPPSPPSNLTLSAGFNFIFASWTNPSDSDLDNIELYYNTTNDVSTALWGAASVDTEAVIAGLKAGTLYYVWARAVDHSGNRSAFTAPVTATPTKIGSTEITDTAIKTQHLDAGAITAEKIAVGAVTANKITTTSLSAFSANLGTVTAGLMQSANGKLQVDMNNIRILMAD